MDDNGPQSVIQCVAQALQETTTNRIQTNRLQPTICHYPLNPHNHTLLLLPLDILAKFPFLAHTHNTHTHMYSTC